MSCVTVSSSIESMCPRGTKVAYISADDLDPILQQTGISLTTKNGLSAPTFHKCQMMTLQGQKPCLAPGKNALFHAVSCRFSPLDLPTAL